MWPQCGFRSCCNASSGLPDWPSAGRASRKSANDSAHDRANRAGYAANRRTCYRASRLLWDWRNLNFLRRLRTFFLFSLWMIRHKIRLLHSLFGVIYFADQSRYSCNENLEFVALFNLTIETSERRSCGCLRERFAGKEAS
jgi:hypothetical protein